MRVLVLGAGVVGSSAAYYLTRAGHEVTIVERNSWAAEECSFANAGLNDANSITPWAAPSVAGIMLREFGRHDAPYLFRLRPDPFMWVWALRFLRHCTGAETRRITSNLRRLAVYSAAAMKEVREAEHIEYEHRTAGIVHVYHDEDALVAAARRFEESDIAVKPRLLNSDGLLALEPALVDSSVRFAGGLHHPADETGDARLFAQSMVEAARRHGATLSFSTEARALQRDGGRVTGADTSKGLIEADATVLACGVQSRRLAAPLGLRLPIYPVKGYSVTIPTGSSNRVPAVALHDHHRRTVFLPLARRLRAAGFAEFDGENKRIDPRRNQALFDSLLAMFPNGGDSSKAEFWSGLRPMTPDCSPLLGTTGIPGLFLDTGHGSHGWMLAAGSGKVVADLISGRKLEIDLIGLTLAR